MIKVENVSMKFRKGSDNVMSIKEFIIAKTTKKISYTDFWVFKDINFEVKKGEVVGIIGRNGAGKSTMLKIISGILTPTEGKVTLGGKVVPMLELGSGFDFDLTGRENIFLNGSILGYSEEFLKERYDEIVEFSELGDFIETPIRNYSSGMLMRLAFAIATIVEPEILIVDEILAVGDEAFQKKSKRKMLELMGGGTTVLFVSHSLAQIREMCNRVVWIENGKVKMVGETKLVCDEYHKYINPNIEESTKKHKASDAPRNFSDVLFIYGDNEFAYDCRVTYQREQLVAGGIASNEIHYEDVNVNLAKLYRSFVCVGCANTENMRRFLKYAKEHNKNVFFDFDAESENGETNPQYELLQLLPECCDAVIVSNEALKKKFESKGYETFLNPIAIEEKLLEYANWCIHDRDVLPYADTTYMSEDELINYNRAIAAHNLRETEGFRIGFFEGDLSSEAFQKVKALLLSIFEKRQDIKLLVDDECQKTPEDMEIYRDRILFRNRGGREDTLRMYSSVDLVLLTSEEEIREQDRIVREWQLAALVKVPCVLVSPKEEKIFISDDLHRATADAPDRLLQIMDWTKTEEGKEFASNIQNKALRMSTFESGYKLSNYVKEQRKKNYVFLLKNNKIGGANWNACHHATLLKRNGYDVTMLVQGIGVSDIVFDGEVLPVVSRDLTYSYQYIDTLVATYFDGARWMQNYQNVTDRIYYVHGYEPAYLDRGDMSRFKAQQMFMPHTVVKYVATGDWCANWLKEKYGQESVILPCGVDCKKAQAHVHRKENQRLKIFIMGDALNQSDHASDVFDIMDSLDENQFDMTYYSYGDGMTRKPVKGKIAEEMSYEELWEQCNTCDVLLDTSENECFRVEQLMVMAGGGLVLVNSKQTYSPWLKLGENCVGFDDIKQAVDILTSLMNESDSGKDISNQAVADAKKFDWSGNDSSVLQHY